MEKKKTDGSQERNLKTLKHSTFGWHEGCWNLRVLSSFLLSSVCQPVAFPNGFLMHPVVLFITHTFSLHFYFILHGFNFCGQGRV
jgi:hypothetical protein